MPSRTADAAGLVIAAAAWAAIVVQGLVSVQTSLALGLSPPHAVVRYFSFFTVLTNTIVAIVLTAPILPAAIRTRLSTASVRAAAATYISLVGLTYSLLLRHIWAPEGMQKALDVALHDVIPVAYVAHWAVFRRTGTLRGSDLLAWMSYPLLYLGYALTYGAIVGWYAYYFIDPGKLGYPRALINAAGITVVFFVLGACVLWLDRRARAGAS